MRPHTALGHLLSKTGFTKVAYNYAATQQKLGRNSEVKSFLKKVIPMARRVIVGEGDTLTLNMRSMYALALYQDEGATLDDLRESVGTLEETTRRMRRVLGAAHPDQVLIEGYLRKSKAELRARETPSPR